MVVLKIPVSTFPPPGRDMLGLKAHTTLPSFLHSFCKSKLKSAGSFPQDFNHVIHSMSFSNSLFYKMVKGKNKLLSCSLTTHTHTHPCMHANIQVYTK